MALNTFYIIFVIFGGGYGNRCVHSSIEKQSHLYLTSQNKYTQ